MSPAVVENSLLLQYSSTMDIQSFIPKSRVYMLTSHKHCDCTQWNLNSLCFIVKHFNNISKIASTLSVMRCLWFDIKKIAFVRVYSWKLSKISNTIWFSILKFKSSSIIIQTRLFIANIVDQVPIKILQQ